MFPVGLDKFKPVLIFSDSKNVRTMRVSTSLFHTLRVDWKIINSEINNLRN